MESYLYLYKSSIVLCAEYSFDTIINTDFLVRIWLILEEI